jgi:uncharacterized protein YggE
MNRRMRRFGIAGLAVAVLAAAVLVAVTRPHGGAAAATDAPNTITVTGNGSVTTVPDRASFAFTAESRAATAAAALAQNATETRAVIAAVKGAGVADDDVQTAQVSLSPQTNDTGKVTGYIASNTISAKIRQLDRAGAVVDAAVGAGATGISGPSLFRSDQDALYRSALKDAVVNARTKAEALAAAANVSLGSVRALVEGGGQTPVFGASDKAGAPASTPIEPGTTEITATVTVTYAAA